MKKLHAAGTLLALCLTITGQTFDRQKLDSLMSHIGENGKGMHSVSIFRKGEQVYQRSIGYADVEARVEATSATVYRIGSISKTFTAAIIMKLVEEGRLELDALLEGYYPGIENAGGITLEMMLRHRSGIYNFTNAPDYPSWMKQSQTREELLKKITGYGSTFQPDERTSYSNANYVLLSLIAEDVTGKTYPELLEEIITKPCGLSHTYYGGRIDASKGEAFSYEMREEWEKTTETDMSVPLGAGGVVSTPTDLNSFLFCLFNGKIVNNQSLVQMMKLNEGFGMGLRQVPFFEKTAYGHPGGIDGFSAMAFYFPADSVSVAITSNGQVMSVNNILIGAMSIYFGRPYEFQEFRETVEVTAEDLEPYPGTYSTPQLPIKLTITRQGNQLFGQGTGQQQFPLNPVGDHTFVFEPAGLRIEFRPADNQMILHQSGARFEMTRED